MPPLRERREDVEALAEWFLRRHRDKARRHISGFSPEVLEALSSGLPVVCSPLAAEGLDLNHAEHLLIGECDDELAAALVRLLDEPNLVTQLARKLAREAKPS